ncbi:sulfite exporter TauE/SafE family protein 3-like isoform X3 [Populus nigra]|uniref:sulfite exporter TauE/SafE family protein 3-like isoform X3 n=1 Tax=Populus nigra TaxID=3691 RepID=UPI002B26F694|nr:sulfite exporter TauE/SafE family protein 3-like isoform X3 [Populus nigra]
MAFLGAKFLSLRPAAILFFTFMLASAFISAERSIKHGVSRLSEAEELEPNYLVKIISFLWQSDDSGYQHVWPELSFNWQAVIGTIIGFFGAAFGSVGGVGGGGIFVPMLTLIIGFDPKSATAISKWTSVKAFFKGLDTWKIETILKEDAAKRFESTAGGSEEVEYKPLPDGQGNDPPKASKVTILQNIYWKELGLLVFVWVSYLAVQIAKNYTAPCSTTFWVLNLLQIPVSIGVFLYEAIGLYKGRRRISSKGDEIMDWQVHRLLMFSACGVVAGIVGGLLGIGGGFVMGPLFLEMGIPPQVSSGTATFGMLFSSSMSAVEYYLLDRFPVPYALYFIAVAIIAAFIGQNIITKLITISGRASLIIFVLAFTIFISAIALGGVGITRTIGMIERHEYMGFENLCKYTAA